MSTATQRTANFTGLWSYNLSSGAWVKESASGAPPGQTGIWAPAWTQDPTTGYCYLTGGATTSGTGDLATVYVYNPSTNAWLTPLPNFNTVRNYHAAFIFTRPSDSHKLLCVAGGSTTNSVRLSSLVLASFARFVEEQYRGEPQTVRWSGLPIYQWLAISFAVLGVLLSIAHGASVKSAQWFSLGGLGLAAAIGLSSAVLMSVDFPSSTRRFSRLTVSAG